MANGEWRTAAVSVVQCPCLRTSPSDSSVGVSLAWLHAVLKAEQRLSGALELPALLLQHRVKNNLQVISTMLKLHAEQANGAAAQAFRDSQDRVRAIALLHETLYQSRDLGNVDLHEYAEGLVRVIQRSAGEAVVVKVEGEHISVPLNLAVPCGLILNELITNAFKHAFPDHAKKDPVIEVHFGRVGSGIEVAVSDNGVGLPAGFAAMTSNSLGMYLVRTLVRQLGGALSFEVQNGTRCTFQFSGKED